MVNKMFDSRKQNPNCGFSAEVVSYIYDEMAADDKSTFENHLAACPLCVAEIASFSSISFAVREWRDEEFAALPTPPIEIPYAQSQVRETVVGGTSKPLFSGIRELFAYPNAFLKSVAAFGVIALTVGLIWFYGAANQSPVDVVVTDDKDAPKTDKQQNQGPTQPNGVIVKEQDNTPEETDSAPLIVQQTPETHQTEKDAAAKSPPKKNPAPKRTGKKFPTVVKKETQPKKNPVKQKNEPKPNQVEDNDLDLREAPRLTYLGRTDSDEEDLRLTDLFADVDSDK
jgi:hypothetical protein